MLPIHLGLLTSEANTASVTSSILKDLLSHHVDPKSFLTLKDKQFDNEGQEGIEASAMKSICAIFENTLSAIDGVPNEHILGVISVLFLKLGMYMPSTTIFCSIMLSLENFTQFN